MSDLIYLDHAAATPMDESVLDAMRPYFSENFFNPSALYLPAKQVQKDIASARESVAHWLGVRGSEIVFTAGGTEANNLATRGVMDMFPGANAVVSEIEHESVLGSAKLYNCRTAPLTTEGIVDTARLFDLIDDNTVLVSVMYANNEVGTIQPIRQISQKLTEIKGKRRQSSNNLPLYFHTDAAQAATYLDLHVSRVGVDLMTINGGKIYGPKGSGALFVGRNVKLKAQLSGGGQERGIRSGTENVAGTIGLAAALDLVQISRHEEAERLSKLQVMFFELLAEKLPQAVVNGSRKHRLPNNVHITLPGQDNERLLVGLEQQGILAAAGSACSASSNEPSHVLRAMGISDADARSSLRFTMGRQTSEGDIKRTAAALHKIATG